MCKRNLMLLFVSFFGPKMPGKRPKHRHPDVILKIIVKWANDKKLKQTTNLLVKDSDD
jgi:hypothetical protein